MRKVGPVFIIVLFAAPLRAAHTIATKGYVDSGLFSRLPLSGGTLTGSLLLYGDPTGASHAATKSYVDNAVASMSAGDGFAQSQADWSDESPSSISYIKNKPVVPQISDSISSSSVWSSSKTSSEIDGRMVQPDWAQTLQTAKDYIKNKPVMPSIDDSAKSAGSLWSSAKIDAEMEQRITGKVSTIADVATVSMLPAKTAITAPTLCYVDETKTQWYNAGQGGDWKNTGGTYATLAQGVKADSALQPFGSQNAGYFYAAPSGAPGTPIFRAVAASDVPTLNQNTTGSAAKWAAPRKVSIKLTGYASGEGSVNIDGSADATINIATSGAAAGTGITLNHSFSIGGSLPSSRYVRLFTLKHVVTQSTLYSVFQFAWGSRIEFFMPFFNYHSNIIGSGTYTTRRMDGYDYNSNDIKLRFFKTSNDYLELWMYYPASNILFETSWQFKVNGGVSESSIEWAPAATAESIRASWPAAGDSADSGGTYTHAFTAVPAPEKGKDVLRGAVSYTSSF
ncbi:MAG: hypothetical protein LBB08_01880 [Rickettsiales bacterium]|jgi:hypothetical protein|nr:hypothetical protein [Rickettsiales bacterium]